MVRMMDQQGQPAETRTWTQSRAKLSAVGCVAVRSWDIPMLTSGGVIESTSRAATCGRGDSTNPRGA